MARQHGVEDCLATRTVKNSHKPSSGHESKGGASGGRIKTTEQDVVRWQELECDAAGWRIVGEKIAQVWIPELLRVVRLWVE